MNWKFPNFGGAQQQQAPSNFPEIPTQSWCPSSVLSSSSRPSTASSSSSVSGSQRTPDGPPAHGQPSPAEAAGIIARLKDKRYVMNFARRHCNLLEKIWKKNPVYWSSGTRYSFSYTFLDTKHFVSQRHGNSQWHQTALLCLAPITCAIIYDIAFWWGKDAATCNITTPSQYMQCTIIRTTELAAAQEKLAELERQTEEILKSYSPAALLGKLHDDINKVDEESEELHAKLLEKEVDLPTFVQKHKNLRTTYHRRALLHLAAKTSVC